MGSISPEQLSFWYQACGTQLVLYGRNWLDAALAEDVVQEVFVRLMGQRTEIRDVRAWLFRAVRNGAISHLRHQKRRKKRDQRIATQQQNWFEPHPDDLIDAQTAQTVLESLPPQQREIVMLRIWGQMTFKEMAGLVDLPLSTVHDHYRTALARIKNKMELSSCKTKKT
jgi:RNA polymerase sigma-70 factor (ECF subfamily)